MNKTQSKYFTITILLLIALTIFNTMRLLHPLFFQKDKPGEAKPVVIVQQTIQLEWKEIEPIGNTTYYITETTCGTIWSGHNGGGILFVPNGECYQKEN